MREENRNFVSKQRFSSKEKRCQLSTTDTWKRVIGIKKIGGEWGPFFIKMCERHPFQTIYDDFVSIESCIHHFVFIKGLIFAF